MIIRRMQVEGGFLDGLDITFEESLNVIIGGRGTGKSSVIELIRYCLNDRVDVGEDAKRAREHALSILQDGQVTLTLEEDNRTSVVSRSANAPPEGLDNLLSRPLIFSQKDVESVGLSVAGRLGMIDFFSVQDVSQKTLERRHVVQAQSSTVEINSLIAEADQIAERLSGADSVRSELVRADLRAAEISKSSVQLEQKQKTLEAISTKSTSFSQAAQTLRQALEITAGYRDKMANIQLFGFALEEWSTPFNSLDSLAVVRSNLRRAQELGEETLGLLEQSVSDLELAIKKLEAERAPLEEQARTIRTEIEDLREGAGTAARHLAGLREQSAQLQSLRALHGQKLLKIARIQEQRNDALDKLDEIRETRSSLRHGVAKELNAKLLPQIRVRVRQAAQMNEFLGAIGNCLRGSGLRYNELATAIVAKITPRELISAAERLDSEFLVRNVGLSPDRAERVINQLRSGGSENVVCVPLDDAVDFELLDGTDFKSIDALSVGQRCTVVLSILLQHPHRVLIIDQPEDHLDNAFIVNTLIGAIRKRSKSGQLIFSTHNANIPVLGEARRVVRMSSNGRRGFVVSAEPLDHPRSVSAITELMEGGSEAFEYRAKFYRRYSNE